MATFILYYAAADHFKFAITPAVTNLVSSLSLLFDCNLSLKITGRLFGMHHLVCAIDFLSHFVSHWYLFPIRFFM